MKKRIKLKGRIKTFMQFSLYLGILLLAIDLAVFLLDVRAGALLLGYTVFYFVITLTLYFYNKPVIMRAGEFCDGVRTDPEENPAGAG